MCKLYVCRTYFSIRHIQKANPGGAHPRAPTWRKVTTEILALRADPTLARGGPPPAICVTSRAPKGAGSHQAPALLARRRPRPFRGRTATPQKKRAFPQRRGPAGPSRIGVPGLGPRASAPGAGGSRRGLAPDVGRDQKFGERRRAGSRREQLHVG